MLRQGVHDEETATLLQPEVSAGEMATRFAGPADTGSRE